MSTVVQVSLRSKHCPQSFSIVETSFTDFDAFLEAVEENRLIRGTELKSMPGGGRGARIVTGRATIVFRGDDVISVSQPTWTFEELPRSA